MTYAAPDAEGPDRAAGRPIATLSDIELYQRGSDTLLAAWEQYARGTRGAAVHRLGGVAAAVFPSAPERGVYNNAILERGLPGAQRTDAIVAMEAAYEAAGIARFAAWVHESDEAMRSELERRGDSATAIAFDHAGDCGIYNVGTTERARRHGLATGLTAMHLHSARARGCQTASVQSTAMAEGVYTAAGFRDLGRILEYVPANPLNSGLAEI